MWEIVKPEKRKDVGLFEKNKKKLLNKEVSGKAFFYVP